jgi:hypothetical protein
MITLQLENDDAKFLADQLASRARAVEHELVHTDKRTLQADIARDLKRLEGLCERLRRTLQ